MLFSPPDLPERRPTVRPEIFSPQPYSGLNVLLAHGVRLGATLHGPVQVAQRATQSQDMGSPWQPIPVPGHPTPALAVPERSERSQRPRRPLLTNPPFAAQRHHLHLWVNLSGALGRSEFQAQFR